MVLKRCWNVRKRDWEELDLPEIPITPLAEEPIGVDLPELKRLLDYAKRVGWI